MFDDRLEVGGSDLGDGLSCNRFGLVHLNYLLDFMPRLWQVEFLPSFREDPKKYGYDRGYYFSEN
jgi:hypothetical protein